MVHAFTLSVSSPISPSGSASYKVPGSCDASPLPLKSISDAKRARRSEIEKQSRQRRQKLLRHMREDARHLETEYASLLQQQLAAIEGSPRALHECSLPQLIAVGRALESEKQKLHQLVQEHTVFQKAVQETWSMQYVDHHSTDKVQKDQRERDCVFAPVNAIELMAIARRCYEKIQIFSLDGDCISSGASMFGWRDKRKLEGSTLTYTFQKRFMGQSAEDLLVRTWETLTDQEKMGVMIFDSSVKLRLRILQVVNDNMVIIRRDHIHRGFDLAYMTVHMLFRLQTPNGYLVVLRTLPVPEVKAHMKSTEAWFDLFHWTFFNYIRDEQGQVVGCEVSVGGSLGDQTVLIAQHWICESMMSVLRWECAVVKPLFILPSETPPSVMQPR